MSSYNYLPNHNSQDAQDKAHSGKKDKKKGFIVENKNEQNKLRKVKKEKFSEENMKLKSQILDMQLREREYIEKINVLEKNNLNMAKKIS